MAVAVIVVFVVMVVIVGAVVSLGGGFVVMDLVYRVGFLAVCRLGGVKPTGGHGG